MRHRMKGRKLGRNGSHRKAMFRNMAASLIKTLDQDVDAEGAAKVPGRIITTTQKAKELRPQIERLVTIARKAALIEEKAREFETGAERGSDEWKQWRQSLQWNEWSQAIAPAVALRRRAYATLRDHDAVSILFSVLAERFADRNGGYTRILKLAKPRLGDAGQRALIEFVGENDRVRASKAKSSLAVQEPETAEVSADAAGAEGDVE
jgi:large subunit ribosomal protein L17